MFLIMNFLLTFEPECLEVSWGMCEDGDPL